MKNQWMKKNGCKFASDAVFNGDWNALRGLMVSKGISADCPWPTNETKKVKVTTWARKYVSTHPNGELVQHDMEVEIGYGTPLLHQVVIAEGIDNKRTYRPGLQMLLENGADINLQDRQNGYTALHYACMLCRSYLMQFLISKKADLDILSKDGRKPAEMMPRWCKTVIRRPQNKEEEDDD